MIITTQNKNFYNDKLNLTNLKLFDTLLRATYVFYKASTSLCGCWREDSSTNYNIFITEKIIFLTVQFQTNLLDRLG